MMRRSGRRLVILVLLLVAATVAPAQDSIQSRRPLITRKNAVIAALVLQQAGSFYLEYHWWWEGKGHPFKIQSDEWFDNYSQGTDKAGHFYISYFYFHLLNDVMKWGGFNNTARTVTAIAFPAAYAVSIELADGFSTFHFSFDDLAANFAGIGYGVLQDKFPPLRNFNVKFGYFPSQAHFDNGFSHWALPEDYNGHSYWLTCNMYNVLPKSMKRYWPEFLNVGIGYGLSGWQLPEPLRREFLIGFDYNLGAIRTKSATARTVLGILDRLHYPAPGLKRLEGENVAPKLLLFN